MQNESSTDAATMDANKTLEKDETPKEEPEETRSFGINPSKTDSEPEQPLDSETSREEAHVEEGKPPSEKKPSDEKKDETQTNGVSTKKPGKKPSAAIAGGIAAIAVVIIVLSMQIFSPQAKADKLYEKGAYAEALKTYEEIGDENKNGSKMSDCRYWMFIDYLLANGPYETSAGDGADVTWAVEGYSNGDITCTVSGGVNGSGGGADTQFAMTIHHGETNADFSASSKILILYISSIETGSGTIDLPSYSYGKTISFDQYENSGNSSNNSYIKKNSGVVTKMIQKGLLGALNASGTGAGLSDLGFTNLD